LLSNGVDPAGLSATPQLLLQNVPRRLDLVNTHVNPRPSSKSTHAFTALGSLAPQALLEIGDNVRDDAALSKSFIASIAENVVLVSVSGFTWANQRSY
jgi:hypothetical protein